MQGSAVFNGVFELREGVTEDDFLPTLKAFYEHFIEIGFASGYRILRREALYRFRSRLTRLSQHRSDLKIQLRPWTTDHAAHAVF